MAAVETFIRPPTPIYSTPEEFMVFKENIEDKRVVALSQYNNSPFPALLGELAEDMGGWILSGREEIPQELMEDLGWPIYEESVVAGFFWVKNDGTRGEHNEFAIGVETMPNGTVFIHGGGLSIDSAFPFGSSFLLPSEWRGNKEAAKKALSKAIASPKIHYQDEYSLVM